MMWAEMTEQLKVQLLVQSSLFLTIATIEPQKHFHYCSMPTGFHIRLQQSSSHIISAVISDKLICPLWFFVVECFLLCVVGSSVGLVRLMLGPVSTGIGDCIRVQLLVREIYLSLTNHPGQLSLAIPPWVGAMSTCQRLSLIHI